ncbi:MULTISPECIES: hypothetical protein [unclassified Luteococcus]|uniref:hypothetical protein n=1 Tax=unclassified Luteococcus TaxID=2639923 RepID=UPI00313C1EC9
MTVAELIAKLQDMPQDAEVLIEYEDGYMNEVYDTEVLDVKQAGVAVHITARI